MESPRLETWRNETAGTVVITKWDQFGRKRQDMIIGGRSFTLTAEERRANQDIVIDPDLDPFTNGILVCVTMPAEEDGTDTSGDWNAQRPDIVMDEEMSDLFDSRKVHPKKFDQRIAVIRNVTTLERLLAYGQRSGEATVRQIDVLNARLNELRPPVGSMIEHADSPDQPGGQVKLDPMQGPQTSRDPLDFQPVTPR